MPWIGITTETGGEPMSTIDATMTLATLVDQHPVLARELERRGLDYCCGGGRTLAQACAETGTDTDTVVAELNALEVQGAPAAWTSMTATELVDHLEATHHAYLWDELPRLSALVEKIRGVHGERHPELDGVAACYARIRADLEPHLLREEQVLFPMIRELDASATTPSFHCGTLLNPIRVMLAEHDTVGELLARLRSLTADFTPPADGCASYAAAYRGLAELEADTHLHIHKENNVLFPLVVRLEAERSTAASR
jgi:regulator of cell morphogenesis and NO signaling